MVITLACLLFQIAPPAQLLPAAASEPSVVVAARATSAPTLDLPAGLPSSHELSGARTVAATEPSGHAAGLMHASSNTASAQNSQSLSTIRVPQPQPAKPIEIIGIRNLPSRKSLLVLSLVQHGAATFDAYATRRAISSGAVEANPLMRPFAGSPTIYAAIQVGPAVLDYVASRMQRSPNRLLRRTWWLPQAASTGLFVFSGAHNLNLAH